ncbi:Isochorismatase hydrolase [Dichomitus squalens LYAD-421 SS1]|uniref:Isochorismatase hydrolase n=1 Tax=Dichomitus squalens (strain LYAD-421) TaxID=732165 RepID=R7SM02_DICSQ|nr:Isochorismatase hydrolase [Dichomitus squalens LYAD-421 SS1]EJF56918.1 Isochorismatase hydrolase [Dichomitus squalens LYAD-421 SS1]
MPSTPSTDHHDLLAHAQDDPERVLILLDVQKNMLAEPPAGVPAGAVVGPNIAKILAYARAAVPPPRIVHVRNCGDAGEPDETGTPGWELVHTPLPGEFVVDKRKNNAFAGTELGKIIPATSEIVMVGIQSDFCIRATCSAALSRGNEVLLVRGAHATYDRIEYHNHGLITSAAEVAKEIEGELEEAGVHMLEMKDLPGLFTDR